MKRELHNSVWFFLDKTHGKLIREMLREVGLQVSVHNTFGWSADMLDTDWIAECGLKNLVILSGDKSIEKVPEERQAVINSKCKVFMFDDSHKTETADWCAALLVARDRILEIITRADGPFFVTIKPCKVRGHISLPRFIEDAGGKWKPAEEVVAEPPAVPLPAPRKLKQQQKEFEFPPSEQGV